MAKIRKVIVLNHKGGVGKTTTAVTLAHLFAQDGHKTLLVDLDAQGHIALSLGLEPQPGLHRLLIGNDPIERIAIQARPNLFALLSNITTEHTKHMVSAMNFRERVLLNVLERAPYDVVLFDAAPSADVLNMAALVASDYLLVPTTLDPLAVDGVRQVVDRAEIVRQQGYPIELAGIVPCMFERRTNESQIQGKDLHKHFKSKLWQPIPRDTNARSAPATGKTLLEFAPHSPCMVGYEETADDGQTKRIGGYYAVYEKLKRLLF